jgi:hypothetical protein
MDDSVAFKNPAFAVEKVWRLVVRSPELPTKGTDDGEHSRLPIRLRSARGQLAPYIRLIPSGVPLARTYRSRASIESVYCGLVGDRGSTWIALRMLFEH